MTGKKKSKRSKELQKGESRRKDGTYQYRWTDENHKRQTVYAPTLQALRKKEKQIQQDIADGINPTSKNITVVEQCETALSLKRGLKAKSIESYRERLRCQIEPYFAKTKIHTVKKSDIVRFYNYLYDKGYSFQTIQQTHNVLRQAFEMAVDDCLLRKNPTNKALTDLRKLSAKEQEEVEALTTAEQNEFFSYIDNHPRFCRNKLFYTFLVETGLRVGEAIALQWNDVDFTANIIHVTKTMVYMKDIGADGKGCGKCKNRIQSPKSKKSIRDIPMTPLAQATLEAYKNSTLECGKKCKVAVDGYADFIFFNTRGGVLTVSNLNKELKRIVAQHNLDIGSSDVLLPDMACHVFRHTFSTRMTERGMNTKALQVIMGHEKADTTMNIYTNASMDFLKQEMERCTPNSTPLTRQITRAYGNIYQLTTA